MADTAREDYIDKHTDNVVDARMRFNKSNNLANYQKLLRTANKELDDDIQSEITKAQEQLLDELEAMIDNHPNYINKSVIEAKRKEVKEGK